MQLQFLYALCLSSLLAPLAVFAGDSISTDLDTYGSGDSQGTPYQTYLSNADVKPPQLQINSNSSGTAPGYVFIGVDGKPTSGQNVPVIYDMSAERMGTLVWTGNYSEPFDFKVQTYKGEPVLTFWSGELLDGYGHGSYYILNQSYVEIAHFSAVGYEDLGDLHEFTITTDDTALVTVYAVSQANLLEFGGLADGYIFDGVFQEIDIESGKVVFEWNSTEHVALNETYNDLGSSGTLDSPFDYFHINSVEKDADGNYLVSARVMDCVYKIDGKTGDIIWRLHGKRSDFDVEDAANFAFQHDARWVDDKAQTRMTIFDNGPTDEVAYSRGLLLDVDQSAKTVRLNTEFANGAKTFAMYEGCLQPINASDEKTNYFLGFGNQPFFAELDADGKILLDVQFGKTNAVNSYRAYKLPWTGKPLTSPDMYYDAGAKKAYLSWNGATEVESWAIYTANTTGANAEWLPLVNVTRTGFETELDLSGVEGRLETYVRGKAANAAGHTIGWTRASNGTAMVDAPVPSSEAVVAQSSSSSVSATSTSSTTATPSATKKSAAVRRCGFSELAALVAAFTAMLFVL
ncbi:uncharacterized protein PV09_03265 [Verruconis gallopava]|uniref:ASST-domain-containing protein n=1 Tax=Verruconis gallopava TaxID=253628 RepID=A0A0D1XTM7_9PEZI|nr:uncharacterized protein PV09_03265 [Verruconis gallopava]KIW06096.1 hypothetical protein PV09_03265 [Verruconis gallopava]